MVSVVSVVEILPGVGLVRVDDIGHVRYLLLWLLVELYLSVKAAATARSSHSLEQPRKKPSDSQTPYAERFGPKHLSAERSEIMNLSARRFDIKN